MSLVLPSGRTNYYRSYRESSRNALKCRMLGSECLVDRRTFVESLGAFYVTANTGLLGRASLLNCETANASLANDGTTTLSLIPLPASVVNVRDPVVSLAGEWSFAADPPAKFWNPDLNTSTWTKVLMPNELTVLGFAITPNTEYPCKKIIRIPADFENKRIFIRFDGVYSYARVWVNGIYVRDHNGGFTSWDCEITDHVKPGEEAVLVVGITDRSDDISQASYYAKHSIAGVLREVRLFAVPRTYLRILNTTITLDAHHQDGLICLAAELSSAEDVSARLDFALKDSSGRPVPMHPNTIPLSSRGEQPTTEIMIPAPKRWDSEHPNLYLFEASVVINDRVTQSIQRKIGFRSISRVGNQLQVNGQSVKLRGVCRHSIHPVYGRAVPVEFDEIDAELFREANINFVRTSHYPPTEQFLDACDSHGIYVEEETAVCWSNVNDGPSSDPRFKGRFLGQFQEMIARDHHHASVLFWSLGNESQWGENFATEREFAAKSDPSRPTIFSYPVTAPLPPSFEIYSKHYPEVNSELSSSTYPLLNDEFAHVSCYNLDTLRRDPGVRNFWGESIRQFGDKFLTADGCLGGSIWAGIDEVFLLQDGPVGYGPWGIIDGWRRRKPEYWLTKKAYSPIRIEDKAIAAPEKGEVLSVPVGNAFDYTNLKDLEIRWSSHSASGSLLSVDVPPHGSGYLEIPPHVWRSGDILQLDFCVKGKMIDQFRLPIGPSAPSLPKPQSAPVTLKRSGNLLQVGGPHFTVTFNQTTGLLTQATFDDQVVLTGGPYVDFGSGPLILNWLLRSCEATTNGEFVNILTAGECKRGEGIESIPVEFDFQIDGAGLITTRYRIQGDITGNSQIGISYLLSANVEKLTWRREALWSVYPDDHIGRPEGVAMKRLNHPSLSYGTKPEWPWSEDIGDFFLWGKQNSSPQASNDFRSLKERIWYASCILAGSDVRARAEGAADIAARVSLLPDGRVVFSLYNFWPYPDLGWGNYTGPDAPPAITTREIRLRLTNLPEEE